MPRVTVIIPTFNRADLLPRAIESVLAQSYQDYELIVVDDGSSDNTPELAVITGNHADFACIRMPNNTGVSAARNRGVRNSSGQLLSFLDSDDLWHREKLARQVTWMDQNPEYQICQTQETWVRNGVRVNPPHSHRKVQGWIYEESLKRCMITPSSVMLKRELFERKEGFDESFPACEDYDLWLRITSDHPVGLVDEYLLTRYGGHEDQLSSSIKILDRYRIQALEKVLRTTHLSVKHRRATETILAKKAHIVANGCRKRGKIREYEYYNTLFERYR